MKTNNQQSIKSNVFKNPGKSPTLFLTFLMMFFLIAPQSVLGTAQNDRNKKTIEYKDATETKQNEMLKMISMLDQLDQLDKLDFKDAINEAERCILACDFNGVEKAISKASTFAHNNQDYNKLQKTRQNLVAKIQFEDAINGARINILSRNFSKARTLLAKAPESARSITDRGLIDIVQDELDSESRLQAREKKERREYKKAQKRLARLEREATNNQVVIDDSNKWVGTAMNAINQTRDQILRDIQQDHNRKMQRIAAKNSRKKKATIQRQREKLSYENDLRQKKLDQQRVDRLRSQKRAIEKRKNALAAREIASTASYNNSSVRSNKNNTSTQPSGPKGLAILWEKENGKWYADGPTQKSSFGEDKQTALGRVVSRSSTTFLTRLNISINNKTMQCEVYRVDVEVDTSWKTSFTRNIRFKYPELKKLKPKGLD